ncbi:CopG family ribbon-helix-helix protein [Maridesulfovibrio ferrireducens]|uniref:CopG family ribbon-helix-helix protein n=1 Tax=Maridesulfovibrio ferrireducens TaxID=246191 RepID=UPI001A3063A2|nr:CopG family transcriptional regulator [Maridesulfovibrio ferrireducens]MBI9112274.1 CopG family transcriptional regulator [Maridesulfovibrio ferrireducens]
MISDEPNSEVVKLRMTSEMKERIEKQAQATKRSKAFLFGEAISRSLDVNEWQVKAIQEGLDEARSPEGKWTLHEDVEAKYFED